MDCLTNFSLKYTEFEDETFYCDSYSDDFIKNGKFDCESTSDNSFTSLSPMTFSRRLSLDTLSTPTSCDGNSVQSDYSCYISSSVSSSDIPDSPSEMMRPSQQKPDCINGDGSPVDDDDEHDDILLESCLQLGIDSMHHPDDHRQSAECRVDSVLTENQYGDSMDNENNLLAKCWQNGVEAFRIRKR